MAIEEPKQRSCSSRTSPSSQFSTILELISTCFFFSRLDTNLLDFTLLFSWQMDSNRLQLQIHFHLWRSFHSATSGTAAGGHFPLFERILILNYGENPIKSTTKLYLRQKQSADIPTKQTLQNFALTEISSHFSHGHFLRILPCLKPNRNRFQFLSINNRKLRHLTVDRHNSQNTENSRKTCLHECGNFLFSSQSEKKRDEQKNASSPRSHTSASKASTNRRRDLKLRNGKHPRSAAAPTQTTTWFCQTLTVGSQGCSCCAKATEANFRWVLLRWVTAVASVKHG